MKRKLRIFSNIAIIALSVCMFAFGVYAASTVSVTTQGTVTFTADNVDATIVRTVDGHDEDKSTVVIDDEENGTATLNINKTTTPEGALHEIKDKFVNEKLVFDENATPIVMTFIITNNSTDRNLKYVLGGSTTGTGIKTKLMTGDRLILIDDDNYLDPYVEGDDSFVNTTTITITFTVADKNVSTELSYNYNIDLSVVKPIVADNFTITSTNATYGSATVLSKAGNTVKASVKLNNGGQFIDFTQSGVEIEQSFVATWQGTNSDETYYILRMSSLSEVSGIKANISQFNTNLYDFGDGLYMDDKALTCKNSSTFNLTHVDVPQLVNNNGIIPITGANFKNCSTLTTIKLSKLHIFVPELSGTGVTEIVLPNIDESFVDNYGYGVIPNYHAFTYGELAKLGIQIVSVIIEDDNVFHDGTNGEEFFTTFPSDKLETLKVSPYNPYYDSRNDCNAIINSETNELIWGCKTTVIPSTVTSIGGLAFNKLPNTFTTLSIPNSVKTINYYAFNGSGSGLTTINYSGTKAEWHAIKIGTTDFNDSTSLLVSELTSLKVVCTDGEIVLKSAS